MSKQKYNSRLLAWFKVFKSGPSRNTNKRFHLIIIRFPFSHCIYRTYMWKKQENIFTFLFRLVFSLLTNEHTHIDTDTYAFLHAAEQYGLYVYSNNWLQVVVFKKNPFFSLVLFIFYCLVLCVVYLKLSSCQFDERNVCFTVINWGWSMPFEIRYGTMENWRSEWKWI